MIAEKPKITERPKSSKKLVKKEVATGEFNIQMPRVSYFDKSTDRIFASVHRYRDLTPEYKSPKL